VSSAAASASEVVSRGLATVGEAVP
jgi:hypothetical protein